jgi:cytochrome c oxidase subunit 3
VRLLRQLGEKPWLPSDGTVVDLHDGSAFALPKATVGLRVFLGVVTVIFTLMVFAYANRMEFEDWRPTPALGLLWLNTAMLVLSSLCMQWARMSMTRADIDGVRLGQTAALVFAVQFIGGQILAWHQLEAMPAFDVTNPAIAFFYMITGIHALHLLGGLVVAGWTTVQAWRGRDLGRLRRPVELCTVYWHFLLIVWLVLFGLLFSGSDNLGFLLALCGLR